MHDFSKLPPKIQETFREWSKLVAEGRPLPEFLEMLRDSQWFRDMERREARDKRFIEELIQHIPPQERIKGLSDEELEKLMEERRKKSASNPTGNTPTAEG